MYREKKGKILHLITGLGVGGTEKYLLRMLPWLSNRFENRVVCLVGRGEIGEELEKVGIKVDYLDYKKLFGWRTVYRFKKVIDNFGPDMLVTYLIHADLFGRVFGRVFGIRKVICSQRGSLENWEWLRKFDKWTNLLVDKYIVQTRVAKRKLMKRLRLPASKFVVIPNGIDLDEFKFRLDKVRKKRELGLKQRYKNLICVSNLRKGKGHECLLEVFEMLFEKYKSVNLLVVGDGEQKEKLLKQVENYKSKQNIYFLGQRDDTKELLGISDIFILMTEAEGMSNAILDAMASGLPVVTTDMAENRELIKNGLSGILAKNFGSKKLLVKKLLSLLKHNSKRKLLGLWARKVVAEKYKIEEVSLRLVWWLRQWLQEEG